MTAVTFYASVHLGLVYFSVCYTSMFFLQPASQAHTPVRPTSSPGGRDHRESGRPEGAPIWAGFPKLQALPLRCAEEETESQPGQPRAQVASSAAPHTLPGSLQGAAQWEKSVPDSSARPVWPGLSDTPGTHVEPEEEGEVSN